jgi:hypothetical protein
MGLAEHGRVLMLDKRGTGFSDRVAGVPTLESRMDVVRRWWTWWLRYWGPRWEGNSSGSARPA